jgi:hypothetical protein
LLHLCAIHIRSAGGQKVLQLMPSVRVCHDARMQALDVLFSNDEVVIFAAANRGFPR